MVTKGVVGGWVALTVALSGFAQLPLAVAEPPSVQATEGGQVLPPGAAEQLEAFRRDAAAAAQGHPVTYGDGQCYPVVVQYIQALGYPWSNHDPSGNVFDLYEHFPTSGLGRFFDQVPFDGGLNPPHVGDVVVYGPGGFVSEHGHTAVVTAVHGSGNALQYEVAEQNSGGRLFMTLDWRDNSPMWNTLGYLRPKP